MLVSPQPQDIYFGAQEKGDKNISECRFNVASIDENKRNKILDCNKRYGSGILILGDSHGTDLFRMSIQKSNKPFIIGITKGGCRPHSPQPDCHYDQVKSFLEKNSTVFSHIVYEQAGHFLMLDENGNKGSRKMFSEIPDTEAVENFSVDLEHVNGTLKYLNHISKFTDIIWFSPRLEPHITKNTLLKKGCKNDWKLRPNLERNFNNLDDVIENKVKGMNNTSLTFVSQNQSMKFDFPRDLGNCNTIYWLDGDHLSKSGVNYFAKRLPDNLFNIK